MRGWRLWHRVFALSTPAKNLQSDLSQRPLRARGILSLMRRHGVESADCFLGMEPRQIKRSLYAARPHDAFVRLLHVSLFAEAAPDERIQFRERLGSEEHRGRRRAALCVCERVSVTQTREKFECQRSAN